MHQGQVTLGQFDSAKCKSRYSIRFNSIRAHVLVVRHPTSQLCPNAPHTPSFCFDLICFDRRSRSYATPPRRSTVCALYSSQTSKARTERLKCLTRGTSATVRNHGCCTYPNFTRCVHSQSRSPRNMCETDIMRDIVNISRGAHFEIDCKGTIRRRITSAISWLSAVMSALHGHSAISRVLRVSKLVVLDVLM